MSPVLRIVDRRVGDTRRVAVSWHGPGGAPQDVEMRVSLAVDATDAEKIRWYLEDYPEFPVDPAPSVAADTESVVAALGKALFDQALGGAARPAWTRATSGSPGLAGLRVEIDANPSDVPGLPWELLREPASGRPVVLAASEFVRTHRQSQEAVVPEPGGDRLRVLLVICRPGGGDDVPFRSVASRLVRGGIERMERLDLDVLRPATYQRLAAVLRAAAAAGRPYHVVHFDGHGAFLDVKDLAEDGDGNGGVALSPLRCAVSVVGPVRPGRHGYLLFEDPDSGSNQQLVDGSTLGGLLVETGVPVLVLNACRSAYAEAQATPVDNDGDVHERVRAYGSLAAEVADAGVPGVVAMRYNVYVVTAAQFVADLYAHLVAGATLGVAATAARKALYANPMRQVGATPVALQDWVVPTVYEAVPLRLLAPAEGAAPVIRIEASDAATAGGVPGAPDVGFFGRDETLLALDRAFDTDQIVLLHAFAGAGKSTTAAEFARWYVATGGLAHSQAGSGPVLWTSFEHHLTLDRVLDVVGTTFAAALEANGKHWGAITDRAERRDLVRQVLAQVPVLWIWDNVEPVAGFPEGTRSAWTDDEQRELVGFLRELKTSTLARVLLTSRRTEDTWLGTLPRRVALPPMPMRERRQLAHTLARHLAPDTPVGGAEEVEWGELLRFTGGNPLTITVALRQALREHVATTGEVAAFTGRLRAGLSPLEEARDAALGRDRSLAASLDYGFTDTFSEPERARLALLHLFRDTVDIDALRAMGNPDIAGADIVELVRGAERDELTELLDRAVGVGLLTGYGGGYYGIHPALPWYFTTLYTHHIGPAGLAAERAFARAYADLGRYYHWEVVEGRSADVLAVLRVEEANLTHALDLARAHQDYGAALDCLQGLRNLYHLTGRDIEWARLVGDIEGDYIDPGTDQPLPGREDHYSVVTGYRVWIARDRRDWPTATRLHTTLTGWDRHRAAPHLDTPTDQLDPTTRNRLRTLAVSEHELGRLLAEQQDPGCLEHYRAAYDLAERIGDTAGQAVAASNFGNAYLFVAGLRDLDQAQHWFERDLDLKPERDRIGRAASHGSLANVARQRFLDARDTGAPGSELLAHLNNAFAGHHHVLELLPPDHHDYRATSHNQLGNLYSEAGDVPQALHHYQQAIQHREARDDTYGAGQTRYNITLLLADAGRVGDALHYARAALANYRAVGPGAATDAAQTEALIQQLERLAQA